MIKLKSISIISVVAVFLLLASVIQNRAWAPTAVEVAPPEFQAIVDDSHRVVVNVIAKLQAQGDSLAVIEEKLGTFSEVLSIIADSLGPNAPRQVAPPLPGGRKGGR